MPGSVARSPQRRNPFRRALARIGADTSGSAAVEFALLAPAVIALIVGTLETALLLLGITLLQSAVDEAARVGLTGNAPPGVSRLDRIRGVLAVRAGNVLDPRLMRLETMIYPSFGEIGLPEPFVDRNANGRYDSGEPFTDVNGSGAWESDMGRAGLGGPNDVVLYRVRYDWRMWTPIGRAFLPEDGTIPLEATIAVRNEPFPGG